MNKQGENGKLKEFLLGVESESDAEEIGVRLIADPEFAEKLSLAEEELVEEFLDDALTAQEKEHFYTNFLTTPARRELLEETALLRSYARRNQNELPNPSQKKTAGFFDGLKAFLSLNLRPIAAVLIIAAIAGIAWRVFLYDGAATPLEKQYAALNAKDLSNLAVTDGFTNKSLLMGAFRDTDPASRLNTANLTENVLFRLDLVPGTPLDALFDLELARGGRIVFRQTKLRVYQNPGGKELKVVLPKSVLAKGAYQIKISDGSIYSFMVE